jgi:hypothetical protein
MGQATDFVTELKSLLGDRYVFGAAGPNTFDCSGLVQYAATKAGYKDVPRTSEGQWQWIKSGDAQINKGQLRPGDLIFSQWPGDNASPGHVQVYLGAGKVIQAPHPGGVVSIASLSSDTGHIVGYGSMAKMGGDMVANPVGGAAATTTGTDVGGLLGEAGDLLHGIAEVLDFAFGFFAPGQGWRIAFGAGAVVGGAGAVKAYTAQNTGSIGGGSAFPLAVGLAGAATMCAFMALRPWPEKAKGPERPGEYISEILSGQPPPAGPARVHETDTIEAGLAVFAVAWLAQKAASGVNSIITGITGALATLGLIAEAA